MVNAPGQVRRKAAGDDQADTAAGAFGIKRRHALEPVLFFFEPGMHRTHQGAIAQRREAEIERGKQVRVRRIGLAVGHEVFSGIIDYLLSKQALGYYRHIALKMQCSKTRRRLPDDTLPV